jgi:arylsulfatase A-like enzyme
MTLRHFLPTAFVAVTTTLLATQAAMAARPNVVVILADDQGWGDLSVHGNTNLSTPNIDSLARDGALFDRFFVCPVCSPTRAEFLTGRYHPRGGVWSTSTGGERLDLDEKTIGDTFKGAGYAVGAFGKWHNGTQYPYHPNARGFDEFYGFCSGHWGDYFDPPLERNGRLVRGHGFISDDLTDHALAFIEANRDHSFFCYLPFNTPHSPMQVPDRFFEKLKNADLRMRYAGPEPEDVDFTRAAMAMCENIDWNVGRVLKRLDELKLADNTIVLYFCDNGPNSWRWNGGMRGRKGSTDEGGVRSPLLMRWPGHVRPGTKVTPIAGAIDLLPTLADLAGIPVVTSKPLDGVSVAPLLRGDPSAGWPDRQLLSHWNGKVSVRSQQYRLDASGRLYDMTVDPGQEKDIAKNRPEITAQLKEAVARWSQELLPGLTNDKRPFPVGYRAFPITWLPARDGVAHGHIKRSSGAPNCSYFTNWTSTDDSITWDVEVMTDGRYQAEVYYTAAAKDAGATLELSLGGRQVLARVSEPFDPPLRGAEHDRVKRNGESYVKDFKPLQLGILNLSKGRGMLTIRARDIPGRRVIDLRTVVLTLID